MLNKILPSTQSTSHQGVPTKATKSIVMQKGRGSAGVSQPCGSETRPGWDFRGALTGAPGGTRGWLRRTAIGGPGGPWVHAWTNNPKMLSVFVPRIATVYLTLLPSKYVLDCLGASCAGGVSTGWRAGGAPGG